MNQHTFAEVCAAALKHGGGIGFILKPEDGIIALDLDRVLTDGMLVQWARRLIDLQPGTYWEISPSGNGVRCFVKGGLPADRCISCAPYPGTKLEVFIREKVRDHHRCAIRERAVDNRAS
jgi:primase-polymerase (primpol)-like protein